MMSLRQTWLVLALLWLLMPAAQAASVSLVSKGVHVDALPTPGDAHHGYVPHRFQVRNSSSKKRTITLTMPAASAGDDKHAIRSIQRTVTVAPGTAMKVVLLQPPLPMGISASDLRVEVEGQRKILKSAFSARHDDAMNLGFQSPRNVLLSRSIDQKDYEDEANRMTTSGGGMGGPPGMHGHGHGTPDVFATFESAPGSLQGWDTQWLAFSLFDAIVLTGSEWDAAPGDVRKTLDRWTRCGGTLFILGKSQFTPPEGWIRERFAIRDAMLFHSGFGVCIVLPINDEDARDTVLQRVKEDWERHDKDAIPLLMPLARGMQVMHDTEEHFHFHGPFGRPRDDEDFNQYFQVVDASRVPVRLVVGLLTAFVILAGPVSLIILHRKGKRLWFLWTLPTLSFSISALVFVVSWLSEGITPRLRIEGITILDQAAQEATTIGGVGLYAPIAPDRLTFSGVTEATPLFEPQTDDPGNNRRVVWTGGGGQSLEGGWVGARVPTHFAIRKTEHREERIEVTWNAANEPVVMNYLGSHIRELFVCREDGVLFVGREITAGAKAKLERSGYHALGDREEFPALPQAALEFSEHAAFKNTVDLASQLIPNSYVAALNSSPFIENPLGQRKAETRFRSHVIGILPEGGTP